MKKTLIYGTATAAVALTLGAGVGLMGCAREQMIETDYGTLPIENSASTATSDRPVETVYGPPPAGEPAPILSEDEPIEDVYGPPVDTDWGNESSSEAPEKPRDGSMIALVYGPPTP